MGTDDTRGGTVTLDTGTTSNASNNKWTDHPAFAFGTTELTGMWVAKFEVSGTISAINIKPSVVAIRGYTMNDVFTASRNMETNSRYGWGTTGTGIDTHLIKNIEWGAATYLSKSSYGKVSEISINTDSNHTTGYTYSTSGGMAASTTGNIYGIYDMNGCSWEYTAAYVNNGNATLTTYGSSLKNAAAQYKDIYTKASIDNNINNYNLAINLKGDAIYETSSTVNDANSWYTDFSYMPATNAPMFSRGGYYLSAAAGGPYAFYYVDGAATTQEFSFRPVLLVDTGL
jgi:hypothetical protein